MVFAKIQDFVKKNYKVLVAIAVVGVVTFYYYTTYMKKNGSEGFENDGMMVTPDVGDRQMEVVHPMEVVHTIESVHPMDEFSGNQGCKCCKELDSKDYMMDIQPYSNDETEKASVEGMYKQSSEEVMPSETIPM